MLRWIGLGLHFFLELAALTALATWGFQTHSSGWEKILFGIGVPLAAASGWGIFRVPGDPGPAVVAIPGFLRLLLELLVLGGAAFGLFAAGHRSLAVWFGGAILVDYILMMERVVRLLGRG